MVRRILSLAFFIALGWFLVAHKGEFFHVAEVVRSIHPVWLLTAAIIEIFYLLSYGSLLMFCVQLMGLPTHLARLTWLYMESVSINTIAPTGGLGGIVYLIYRAAEKHREGHQRAAVSTGVLLTYLLDYSALAFLVAIGLVFLFIHHKVTRLEIITAGILFFLIICVFALLFLLLKFGPQFLHFLRACERLGDKVLQLVRPQAAPKAWASQTRRSLQHILETMQTKQQQLIVGFGLALFSRLIDMLILASLVSAFGLTLSWGTIVTAYAMGMLFKIISITPQGIGVVESILTFIFVSSGVATPIAVALAITYRMITFWLPCLVGLGGLAASHIPLLARPED